jgi:hypothetical protein
LTSPQAAMVSMSAAFIAAIVGFRSPFSTPWSWKAWREVSRSVPFAWRVASASSASHCAGVTNPPGSRVRIMKLYAGSSLAWRRASALSRSCC